MTQRPRKAHNLGSIMDRFTQSALLIALTTAAALALRQWCIHVLKSNAISESAPAALLARALKTPSLLWCFAAALDLAAHMGDFSEQHLSWIRLSIAAMKTCPLPPQACPER